MDALPGLTWAESRRKAAHIAAFWPALLLPWLTPTQALGVTALLLLMNLFILPVAAPGLYRTEADGMGALEIILYPAALAACAAAFGPPADAPSAALGKHAWYLPLGAAWFALAVVDGAIGIGCRLARVGPTLPWNPRKPVAGVLLGAALAALPAAYLARAALPPEALTPAAWGALAVLYLVAVLAETAWFGVADNVVIPFALCVVIPLFPNPLWPGAVASVETPAVWLLGVPAAFGMLAWAARLLTPGGAAAGAVMAFLMMAADPWLFAFLAGFFALGNAATRIGFAGKQAKGLAEARGGRRGAAEVFGAMGVAAWMTPLAHLASASGDPARLRAALLVAVAPLAAKTMDTVSSEIGKAVGGTTFSLTSLRVVPPGSEGGISLAGTLAGLAAAILLAAGIIPLGWGDWTAVAGLTAIAVAANLFEAFWGEYAERRDLDQGPHTNVLMTLLAAVLAWLLFAR